MDLKALRNYDNWIGQTPSDVYWSVIRAGGWRHVFPVGIPRWASRIRQYFNLTPMTLKLLDREESKQHLGKLKKDYQTALLKGKVLYVPADLAFPETPVVKPDPNDTIETSVRAGIGEAGALSDYVYEDVRGRSIWFQMNPGGAIYHFGKEVQNPTKEAIDATIAGQEHAPVFKLVCPDGTGGSREVCIKNPFNVPHTIELASYMIEKNADGTNRKVTAWTGRTTIGAVNEEVKVADRVVTDSVAQGSYNYAETTVRGLLAHEKFDVKTDPMKRGYYVEPPDLFKLSELHFRRFPEKDPQGRPLAAQTAPAPG